MHSVADACASYSPRCHCASPRCSLVIHKHPLTPLISRLLTAAPTPPLCLCRTRAAPRRTWFGWGRSRRARSAPSRTALRPRSRRCAQQEVVVQLMACQEVPLTARSSSMPLWAAMAGSGQERSSAGLGGRVGRQGGAARPLARVAGEPSSRRHGRAGTELPSGVRELLSWQARLGLSSSSCLNV